MQKFLRLSLFLLGLLQVALLLCSWEQPAHAYVDPGSGFVVLQVLGSMAAGAVFYLRHKIRRVFSVFRKKEEQPSEPTPRMPEPRA